MYRPGRMAAAVAAHKIGTAPAAADCPSTVPAVRPSLRRSRAVAQRGAVAGEVAAGPAGCAATARVGLPAAAEAPAELRGEQEVGQLGRAIADRRCSRAEAPVGSPRTSRPMRCMCELTVTMRERSVVTIRSSSRPVRAKWPKWFVPICNSNPSAVSR